MCIVNCTIMTSGDMHHGPQAHYTYVSGAKHTRRRSAVEAPVFFAYDVGAPLISAIHLMAHVGRLVRCRGRCVASRKEEYGADEAKQRRHSQMRRRALPRRKGRPPRWREESWRPFAVQSLDRWWKDGMMKISVILPWTTFPARAMALPRGLLEVARRCLSWSSLAWPRVGGPAWGTLCLHGAS